MSSPHTEHKLELGREKECRCVKESSLLLLKEIVVSWYVEVRSTVLQISTDRMKRDSNNVKLNGFHVLRRTG